MKSVSRSVAVVIRGDERGPGGRVLSVRRPPDDPDLPDIWGLPAASLREGEGWDAAVERIGRDKLGVELEVAAELREGTLQRAADLLHMKLYEARIVEGEPEVPQPCRGVTQYVEWRWADPRELAVGARRGSLCCRLYLRELGRGWRRQDAAEP